MKRAELRVTKVAETRFVAAGSDGDPWQIWQTDTENDAAKLVEFAGRLCYDSRTEVLTENGWKSFADMIPSEKVATLNPKHHVIEYQKPADYIAYRYGGPMYYVRTKHIDLLVTPDHRMYHRNLHGASFRFETAQGTLGKNVAYLHAADGWLGEEVEHFVLPEVTISQRNRNRAIKAADLEGSVRTLVRPPLTLPMDHFLEFLGYYIAEGFLHSDGRGHHSIAITQRLDRMAPITDVVGKLCLVSRISPDPRKPHIATLYTSNRQLAEYLRPLGKSKEKFIPREFLALGRRQLKILFDALMFGDGTGDKLYQTASPRLADDVSELAFKLGYRAPISVFSENDPTLTTMYRIGISRRRETSVQHQRGRRDGMAHYHGMVFCLTVPNGIIYVRRNGKPVFCGNCYQSWSKPNPATRPNENYIGHILESQHFSVLEHAGFAVAVTGISRSCSHELVRHRHLSFSQISQRFFDETDAAAVVPSLYRDDPDALVVLDEVYRFTMDAYKRLVEIGTRKLASMRDKSHRRKRVREAARAVLPNMTEVHIVISGNHRAWREFFEKRGDPHADPEIREVAVKIFKEVAQPLAPAIYQDMSIEEVTLDTGERWESIRRQSPQPAHADS